MRLLQLGQTRLSQILHNTILKMLRGADKLQRMDFAVTFSFLEPYHKDGEEFLNHVTWVIGDETWVSIVNVETSEQSR
jgi:hypothetical protein